MSTKDRAERTKARPDDILELGLGFFFFPRRGVPGKKPTMTTGLFALPPYFLLNCILYQYHTISQ